jgi:hypothetical protein
MVSADDRSQTSTLLFVLKLLVVNMDELSEPHELGKDLQKIKKLAQNVDSGNGSARGPDSQKYSVEWRPVVNIRVH